MHGEAHTLSIDGKINLLNDAVGAKDFSDVCFRDVLCELFNYDLLKQKISYGVPLSNSSEIRKANVRSHKCKTR